MKTDIQSKNDIVQLIDTFYAKVKSNNLIGYIFTEIAQLNWEHHLPIMYDFWSSMLLGDQSYRGNPFQKHLPLPVQPQHFQQWLKLFHQTVNENFEGEKAEEVKMRAETIAGIFQVRMGLTKA